MAEDGGRDNVWTLIESGDVLAWERGELILRPCTDVLIRDGRIARIGESMSEPLPEDTVRIDARACIVAPGFVDLHCHVTDTPFTRGILEDGGTRELGGSGLYEHLPAVRAAMEPEDEIVAAECGFEELLLSGVTTVVEMGYQTEVRSGGDLDVVAEIAELAARLGIRLYIAPRFKSGHWTYGAGSVGYEWYADDGRERFADCVRFLDRVDGSHGGLVRAMLAPAQIDTCSAGLLRETASVSREREWPVELHAGQSRHEFFEMLERHGCSGVTWLDRLGVLDRRFVVGHGLFLSHHSRVRHDEGADLETLARAGAAVAHCPVVFGRRGIVFESFDRYRAAGIRVGIGTDTFPQDMLNELRIGATLAKVVEGDQSAAAARDVFDAATVVGAEILGRRDLGRIEVGARADLVIWRSATPGDAPVRDPIKSLIYGRRTGSAATVLVDGKVVVADNRVTSAAPDASSRLQGAAQRVWARIPEIDRLAPPSVRRGDVSST